MKTDTPILELVIEIMEEGKFSKSKKTDTFLGKEIENLFKIHKKQGTEQSAKKIYDKIAELAGFGRGELANKFAMKFEKEIGYEDF